MKIIDMHVHSLACGHMCGGEVDATMERVTKDLEVFGVERAAFMPINDLSYQPVREMNDYLVAKTSQHPMHVGFIDLDLSKAHYYKGIENLEEEITYYYKKGLKGIKVHLQNLHLKADDWRLIPLYRLAGELDIPLTIHLYGASPPGLLDDSSPLGLEKMIRAFHKTTFIIAHLGGVKHIGDMASLAHENVYFDTSGVLEELKNHLGIKRLSLYLEEIGYDKLLFASDYPVASFERAVAILKEATPEEVHDQVFYQNALALGKRFKWW